MVARRAALLLLTGLLALTLPAAGQGPPPRDPRAERIVEALMIWRLVDELNLSEQQIARIFPRIKALKELRIELGRRMRALRKELRTLLAAQPRNEEEIAARLNELRQLHEQMERQRQRILQQIHGVLTLEQRAQFVLIQETFEAETIRLLEEVRRLVEEGGRR